MSNCFLHTHNQIVQCVIDLIAPLLVKQMALLNRLGHQFPHLHCNCLWRLLINQRNDNWCNYVGRVFLEKTIHEVDDVVSVYVNSVFDLVVRLPTPDL
jgi:hypothetical protein